MKKGATHPTVGGGAAVAVGAGGNGGNVRGSRTTEYDEKCVMLTATVAVPGDPPTLSQMFESVLNQYTAV